MKKIIKLIGSVPLFLFMVLFFTLPIQAATLFYVDPDWTGSQTGSATSPWTYLSSSAWSTIDSALASGDVTVYFSARNAGSDTDETSSTALNILRTNSSSNRITLDGMSQYNTNDSSPSWSAYSGSSRFRITTDYPLSSWNDSSPYPFRNYVTIRGFRFASTNGKIANLKNMGNLIFELNDCSHTSATTDGPGILVGRPQSGVNTGPFAAHIIIRNNFIHDTDGEGIYIGGSTSDPATGNVRCHDDVLIEGNKIVDAGRYGGQGDGIDIKDGNTNVVIRGNTIYKSAGPVTEDISGIYLQSGSVIERNFVYNYGVGNGINTSSSWCNSFGRSDLEIRNNIIVNVPSVGINLYGGTNSGCAWTNVKVYSNTIYKNTDDGILIGADSGLVTVTALKDNIVWNNGGAQLRVSGGGTLQSAHDYNNYYNSAGGTLVQAASSYSASNITSFEAHAMAVDPQVVSTSTTYVPENFKLKSTSPCIGTGTAISTFVNDYFGSARVLPWDMGPAMSGASVVLAPPTGLRVVP